MGKTAIKILMQIISLVMNKWKGTPRISSNIINKEQLKTWYYFAKRKKIETKRNEKYISNRKEALKDENVNLGCMQNETIP